MKYFIFLLLLTSCATRHVAVVDRTTHDTLYLTRNHYDSIYIYKSQTTTYHPARFDQKTKDLSPNYTTLNPSNPSNPSNFSNPSNPSSPLHPLHSLHSRATLDTLIIRDTSIEYRYKYLRDTLYRSKVDTIPVVHTVEVTKQVPRPLTWFDHLCRTTFFLLLLALLVWLLPKLNLLK